MFDEIKKLHSKYAITIENIDCDIETKDAALYVLKSHLINGMIIINKDNAKAQKGIHLLKEGFEKAKTIANYPRFA